MTIDVGPQTTVAASAPNGTYYVVVVAAGSCGHSAESNQVVVTVGAGSGPLTRSTVDRADDATGYQVKVLYLLPSDADDEQLDGNGTLAQSAEHNGRSALVRA